MGTWFIPKGRGWTLNWKERLLLQSLMESEEGKLKRRLTHPQLQLQQGMELEAVRPW